MNIKKYVANMNKKQYDSKDDPGVLSVTKIFNYYKKFGYKTVVMGASFRNIVTKIDDHNENYVIPKLLEELERSYEPVCKVLTLEAATKSNLQKISLTEAEFRWLLNEDQMATDKLSDGIRKFATDVRKLEKLLHEKIQS
ncbi:hypothetical protein E2986_04814 [Frieseomelitta varia]|uniref:Transaldolase n=1 Tax=Frieseomelitta varia TaxID=561572 RepID=A0A833WG64_9HYME|nr:hypothetical protein E2986_04814 [Frieseomelitta varia]